MFLEPRGSHETDPFEADPRLESFARAFAEALREPCKGLVVYGERLKALYARMGKGYVPTDTEVSKAIVGDLLAQLGIKGLGAAE